MSETMIIEAVRKAVTVDCAVEEAFRIFTGDTLSWWPVETHSIHRSVAEIVFEPKAGGEVYELGADGDRAHWATVVTWEPPSRLVLSWNVGNAFARPTEVEVRFVADGSRTIVELEHRGWDALTGGVERRGNYETGWDYVLGRYVERTG